MDIKEFLGDYISETEELLSKLDTDIVRAETDRNALKNAFRHFHTIKGASAFMGFGGIESLTHKLEDLLNRWYEEGGMPPKSASFLLSCVAEVRRAVAEIKRGGGEPAGAFDALAKRVDDLLAGRADVADVAAELDVSALEEDVEEAGASVRLDVEVLDRIMNTLSDSLVLRNRLASTLEAAGVSDEVETAFNQLNVSLRVLQDEMTKLRMVPFRRLFNRFEKVVFELADSFDKRVEFVVEGGDVELDRSIYERVYEPLVHIFRNSIDHGIESPAERAAAGKPERGTVKLSARQEGERLLVEVRDDGVGIDLERVRAAAVKRGFAEEGAKLSRADLFNLLFTSGFSTRDTVTSVSGRGVGLDVVKSMLEKVGGFVSVDSEPGKGTVFTLNAPLTVIITPLLMVRVTSETYAVPVSVVSRIMDYERLDRDTVDGELVVTVGDEMVKLVHLAEFLDVMSDAPPEDAVMVSLGNVRTVVAVDVVVGREDAAVKPLPPALSSAKGFIGIMVGKGGNAVLVLDMAYILSRGRRVYA